MLASLIRTIVPVVVGALGTWLIRIGVHVDDAALTEVVTAALSAAYYVLARLLEHRWPRLGVLLGVPRQPTYK